MVVDFRCSGKGSGEVGECICCFDDPDFLLFTFTKYQYEFYKIWLKNVC